MNFESISGVERSKTRKEFLNSILMEMEFPSLNRIMIEKYPLIIVEKKK